MLKLGRTPAGPQIKNTRKQHQWRAVSGYDPEQDGPDPQWGRIGIACGKCGETRRISCGINNPFIAYGCVRKGDPRQWRKGDLLIRENAYLDQFVGWLPDGRALTYNTGGHYHESNPGELTPNLGKQES